LEQKENKKAVLFDMDGVIYNSMPNHAKSWHEAMATFGLDMAPEEAYLYEGMRGVETIKLLARKQWHRELSDEEAARMYAVKSATFAQCPPPAKMDGITMLMEQIKAQGMTICVVTGSGQQNRDEELFDHKPFLVLADYLARHGIASLRYDDRATGASVGGDVQNVTTETFMHDAAAGIEYLQGLKAFGKVGCLGHSEGGSIAFMLAARGKVDFIVTLAAPCVKGDTLLAAQVNHLLALSGQPATMTVSQYRQQQAVQQSPWLRWFIDYDPSSDIRQTRCPVLALNGDRDCQVISSLNLTAIRRLLPSSGFNLLTEYPSLNHLFQHSTTGLPNEYRQIEETISPNVLQDIANWINEIK